MNVVIFCYILLKWFQPNHYSFINTMLSFTILLLRRIPVALWHNQESTKYFQEEPIIIIVAAIKKLGISPSTLCRIKVKKLGIKGFKKNCTKVCKGSREPCKDCLQEICDALSRKVAVIDDETYVILNPTETPCRKFYHCQNSKEVDYEQKAKKKPKFPENF